jgi:hypothetical protein
MPVAYEALMVEDSGVPEIPWLALATGRQGDIARAQRVNGHVMHRGK